MNIVLKWITCNSIAKVKITKQKQFLCFQKETKIIFK